MQQFLESINAVVGVKGSFLCDEDGLVLATALPSAANPMALSAVCRTAAQTVAGLRAVRRRRVGDLDLLYAEGRLIVKSLPGGCLCILCAPQVNVPLLNLTANVAARKIATRLKEERQADKATTMLEAPTGLKPKTGHQDKPPAAKPDRLSSFLNPFGR